MSFAWLLPIGFAALAAWLLPLLIHLARRSEHRVTDFAALRWLSAKPQPRRRVRFDEWPLLLLRLLLIAAVAALLAQPVLFGAPDRRPWLVAMPTIPASQVRAAAGDASTQLHWLGSGFPALDAAGTPPADAGADSASQPSFASLLRELDATLPAGTPLTVLVPDTLDGADAQRPRLSRRIDWQIVPGIVPARIAPARAVGTAPRVIVCCAAADAPALRYLRAANAAWTRAATAPNARAADGMRFETSVDALDANARHLVWLAPGALPDSVRKWIASGGRALVASDTVSPATANVTAAWRDDDGATLVRSATFGRGRIFQWTRPLSPDAMPQLLDAGFPEHLRKLFDADAPAPARVDARAYSPETGLAPYAETPRPLAPWLIALVALLFAVERWVASGARRGGAP